MRRSRLAGLALGLAVIGTSGAIFLTSSSKDRPTAAVPHVQAAPPLGGNAAAAMPSLEGRIVISSSQLREAYAAGLIDRPIKSLLNVRSRLTYGDFVWNDRDVPAGPVWVRIDLRSQILSVFRSGHEIGTAVVLYGTDGLQTPTGKFPIQAKLRNHRSATYDNAPMPYTLRLTEDGVAIHGSNVRWGFATHGCVGVPTAFAAKLFQAVSIGDDVLIVS
jgi:hypothetical protein